MHIKNDASFVQYACQTWDAITPDAENVLKYSLTPFLGYPIHWLANTGPMMKITGLAKLLLPSRLMGSLEALTHLGMWIGETKTRMSVAAGSLFVAQIALQYFNDLYFEDACADYSPRIQEVYLQTKEDKLKASWSALEKTTANWLDQIVNLDDGETKFSEVELLNSYQFPSLKEFLIQNKLSPSFIEVLKFLDQEGTLKVDLYQIDLSNREDRIALFKDLNQLRQNHLQTQFLDSLITNLGAKIDQEKGKWGYQLLNLVLEPANPIFKVSQADLKEALNKVYCALSLYLLQHQIAQAPTSALTEQLLCELLQWVEPEFIEKMDWLKLKPENIQSSKTFKWLEGHISTEIENVNTRLVFEIINRLDVPRIKELLQLDKKLTSITKEQMMNFFYLLLKSYKETPSSFYVLQLTQILKIKLSA